MINFADRSRCTQQPIIAQSFDDLVDDREVRTWVIVGVIDRFDLEFVEILAD